MPSSTANQIHQFFTKKFPDAKIAPLGEFEAQEIVPTLEVDSLAIVRLVVEIEVQFDVELPDSTLINIKTFGDLVSAANNQEPTKTEEKALS